MDEGHLRASPLSGIPFDGPVARRPVDLWDDLKAGLDFVAHNLPRAHRLLVRLNPYPEPWEAVEVPAADGAALAAWYGPGRTGAPAVVLAPGTFQTKDDTSRKRRAIDLWRRLGAHVLILDLRGFGGSWQHLGTAGYLESRDLHHAADWLRGRAGVDRAILWGESLGGAAALVAGALPGARERFARIVAWSPFADLAEATRVSDPRTRRGRTLVGHAYRALLRVRTRNQVRDFGEYLQAQARAMGMAPDALVRAASPVHCLRDLQVPAVVFHAEDDDIVPVLHARLLADCDAPRCAVHVLPRGRHLDFQRAAPAWYRLVTRALLSGHEVAT